MTTTTKAPILSKDARHMLAVLILNGGAYDPALAAREGFTPRTPLRDETGALARLVKVGLAEDTGTVRTMATFTPQGGAMVRSAIRTVPVVRLTDAGLNLVTGAACPADVWSTVIRAQEDRAAARRWWAGARG